MEQKEKRVNKSKRRLRELWDTIKQTNICIWESQKEKRTRVRGKKVSEQIMAGNFPNKRKEMNFKKPKKF